MKKVTELERLRHKYNLTRRVVSDLLGVSEFAIFRWSKGTKPHPFIAEKVDVLVKALQEKEAHDES